MVMEALQDWFSRMDDYCHVCGKDQKERPAIYRGEIWCSDHCRKVLSGERSPYLQDKSS